MFSNIFLNQENLLHNVRTLSNIANAKLCVMVKANAYGHGAREIVEMLGDEVEFLGVSNQREAFDLREMTLKEIIVFGKCEDYDECILKDISFALFSLEQAKEILNLSKKLSRKPKMHLCINSGMNRYGVKDVKEFKKILLLLEKHSLSLEGLYTHFSSLTTDVEYTKKQYEIFKEFSSLLPKDWKTIKHIGGGRSIFENFDADAYRVGLEVYGYGHELLKPVLSVESQIVSITNVKKGEHVGYLCGFTAEKDMKVATIPLGYGDGFPRKLSNKLNVKLNGGHVSNVGNICMDAFMVDVTKMKCKVGDRVIVLENATSLAKILGTTEYEVLTNLLRFRGERKIY